MAEADESDRSFLKLYPTLAIVTIWISSTWTAIRLWTKSRRPSLEFINRIPFYGHAVVCLDDPHVQSIIPNIKKRLVTYGLSSQAMIRGRRPSFEGGISSFQVYRENELLGEIRLPMPGIHNVVNALAAAAWRTSAMCHLRGRRKRSIRSQGSTPIHPAGQAAGVTVIDDYGHHPAEIRAVLQAARQIAARRIAILFQPHRYTRTQRCSSNSSPVSTTRTSLHHRDLRCERRPHRGCFRRDLAEAIRRRGHKTVRFLEDRAAIAAEVAADLEPGDMLITLGAGDVTALGPQILEKLRKKEGVHE